MLCNLQSFVLVLMTWTVACDGFFWNTQPAAEQQKSLPLSYFRTYSYHPLTLQSPQQLPQTYRLVPTTNNVFTPQLLSKSSPAGTFTPQTILAPTNIVSGQQQQQSQNVAGLPPTIQHQSPQVQPQQQFNQYPDMSGFHSMMQPSQPLPPHPMPLQQQSQQPLRQAPFYQENPFQYIPPPPQYNMQQVQFVPCMCPVTLSLPNEPLPQVEKRIDEGISSNINTNSVSVEPQHMIESNPDNKL